MPAATLISDPNTGIFASRTEREGYRGVLIAIQEQVIPFHTGECTTARAIEAFLSIAWRTIDIAH